MKLFRILRDRLRALRQRDSVLNDIDREMRSHLELQVDANIRAGMSPHEAREKATRSFGNINRAVLHSIAYARSMTPDRLIAVSVVTSAAEQRSMEDAWEQHRIPIELRIIFSPYRDLTGPLLKVIDEIDAERSDDVITVVLSEFVVEHWWEQPLHNHSALLLRSRLRKRRNTVVTSVPVHVRDHQHQESEPTPAVKE